MDDQSQISVSPSAISTKNNFGGRRLTEPEESGIVRDRDDEFHITRHVGLLLALGTSMFVVCQTLFSPLFISLSYITIIF